MPLIYNFIFNNMSITARSFSFNNHRYNQKPSLQNTRYNKQFSLNKYQKSETFGQLNSIKNKHPLAPISVKSNPIHSPINNRQRGQFLKEMIDEYFKQDSFLSVKMPHFSRKKIMSDTIKQQKFAVRRAKMSPKIDEQLTKSVEVGQFIDLKNTAPAQAKFDQSFNVNIKWPVVAQRQLPPIHQLSQDQQFLQHSFSEISSSPINLTATSFFGNTMSALSEYIDSDKVINEEKVSTHDNEIYTIFIILQNKKPLFRLKQFKASGQAVMERQLKMKNYGVINLWNESKYNDCSFVSSMSPPVKDLLSKISIDQINPQQFKIKPRSIYRKLMANNCQELIFLIKSLCQELLKVDGRVINNKINPSNIFMMKGGDRLALGEWGYSSFRQQFNIQMNKFQSRHYGFLRGQFDWFVTPQYLAPQIIRNLLGQNNEDVWEGNGGSPDIWSLGLTIFQFMTLIPISVNNKCSITSRPGVIRNGLLGTTNRDLHKLLDKQLKAQKNMRKCLYTELTGSQLNQKLIQVVLKMVEPERHNRIGLSQIIELL